MIDGYVLVDKPAGPTSHDVVAVGRRVLGTRRIGHAGTLDPFATGLLVLLVGRATRLMPYVVGLPKTYRGTMRLGERTTTDDCTGDPLGDPQPMDIDDAAIARALEAHTGALAQRPPAYSAKKLDGQRAHRRARRGESVELPPHPIEVHTFRMIARRGHDVDFETSVSSGTYVRSLARDVGDTLGCGAHLTVLRRLKIGTWRVEEAVPLAQLAEGGAAPLPAAGAVAHLPTRAVSDAERAEIRHGRPLAGGDAWDVPVVALVAERTLVAIAEPAGDLLKPRVVLDA